MKQLTLTLAVVGLLSCGERGQGQIGADARKAAEDFEAAVKKIEDKCLKAGFIYGYTAARVAMNPTEVERVKPACAEANKIHAAAAAEAKALKIPTIPLAEEYAKALNRYLESGHKKFNAQTEALVRIFENKALSADEKKKQINEIATPDPENQAHFAELKKIRKAFAEKYQLPARK